MADSILVRHVVGGIWKRAPLITPSGNPATVHHLRPNFAWCGGLQPAIGPDWRVCLNDSRGLGLAGLAAGVAQRLQLQELGLSQVDWSPGSILRFIEDYELWPEAVPNQDQPEHKSLIALSQYFRLTDDLCARLTSSVMIMRFAIGFKTTADGG